MRDCCKDPGNHVTWWSKGVAADKKVTQCRVCGCRQIEFTCDVGEIGLVPAK